MNTAPDTQKVLIVLPLVITTCRYEVNEDTVSLWLTDAEASPLREVGLKPEAVDASVQFNGRNWLLELPKGKVLTLSNLNIPSCILEAPKPVMDALSLSGLANMATALIFAAYCAACGLTGCQQLLLTTVLTPPHKAITWARTALASFLAPDPRETPSSLPYEFSAVAFLRHILTGSGCGGK